MIPKNILGKYNYLTDDSILVGYRGSIAHGMYVPQSDPNSIDDKDVMAIIIPDINYYFGLKEFGSRGTKEIKVDEWDIVAYEFLKFIRLLRKGNPNVLSMLWLAEQDYMKVTAVGRILIANRALFTTKQVYHSFVGYAYGQLKRMEHFKFEGYMGEKRKRLVKKYGYDTKNASHLIRLLHMGIEFLNEGHLYVRRSDSQYLLEIKRGCMTLDQVKLEAQKLFDRIHTVYDNCKLPSTVDNNKINDLCRRILCKHFGYH